MLRRKITFKLYPNSRQERVLREWLELHRELYNAALEERRESYRRARISVSYYDQQDQLPAIKLERPDLTPLGSHALQETLRRLDRAFGAFFRRCKAGEKPGYPRFKGRGRFKGWTYPDPAGWKIRHENRRLWRVYLSNLGWIRAHGLTRFTEFEPNDLTIQHAHGEWFASVTVRVAEEQCARKRMDDRRRGFDFGLDSLVTFDDGETLDNPRWLRESLDRIGKLQRERSRKRKGSSRWKQRSRTIASIHEKITHKRLDHHHKLTTRMVSECELLATEKLAPKNMSASAKGIIDAPGRNVRQKAGLNREILSAGWGQLHQMLAYKAEEAGTRLHLAETQHLKPTQRCSACGFVEKKRLADRVHHCTDCGFTTGRDRNSAVNCLLDAFGYAPGTGATTAREGPLPVPHGTSKADLKTRETTTMPSHGAR